jgi:hypothetical protein
MVSGFLFEIEIHPDLRIIEKLEYMTAMSRVVRADPLRRHLLLSLRGPEEGIPLLPLPSGDFDLGSSTLGPLFPLSTKPSSELTDVDREALSETVASLSGPGPWSLDMNSPYLSVKHIVRSGL